MNYSVSLILFGDLWGNWAYAMRLWCVFKWSLGKHVHLEKSQSAPAFSWSRETEEYRLECVLLFFSDLNERNLPHWAVKEKLALAINDSDQKWEKERGLYQSFCETHGRPWFNQEETVWTHKDMPQRGGRKTKEIIDDYKLFLYVLTCRCRHGDKSECFVY